jgi:CheY-like chemotaxis protein
MALKGISQRREAPTGAFNDPVRSRFMEPPRSSPTSFALLVEGYQPIRMDAATILEDAGFKVLDVATSDAALDILIQHGRALTLLFTSVGLGGKLNGFALAKMVASDYPNISIVVASEHYRPGPGDLPDSACFIPKPFSAGIVLEHLQRIIPDEKKPASLR